VWDVDALYCIHCWAELPAEATVCPTCGQPIDDATADIIEKYIAALHHPQAETRLRAAWMLGRMQAGCAVPALQDIVRTRGQGDPYLLSAAVRSLGQIGDERAAPLLAELLSDERASFMARVGAVQALDQIGGEQAHTAITGAASDVNERVREAARTLLAQQAEGQH
jgi:HEAT repeat protein